MLKKRILFLVLVIFFIIVIIPAFVLLIFKLMPAKLSPSPARPIIVLNHKTNELMEMELEEYLIGVVAQEMPASFEIEALKAQAIAARTYAYKRLAEPDPKVKELNQKADISTDPAISQAWISRSEMRNKWGFWDSLNYQKKIALAVSDTKDQVLVYDKKLIDPVYHSSCGGGWTENSEEVWKNPFPYLVSVRCADHQEGYRQDQKSINIKEMNKALGFKLNQIVAKNSFKIIEKSSAGRIKQIEINGKVFTGADLRSKLGLRSTWLSWEIAGERIEFTTRGYGHGVGMCQYGANHFAKEGKTCLEILRHYYQGVEIMRLK